MWLRKTPERHFLLLHLLIVGFTRARTVDVSEEVTRESKVTFEESSASSEDRYPVHETTTSASSSESIVNDDRKLKSPIVVEALPRNDTDVFRPSVHLGEIEQSTIRANPFNHVQDMRFENNVHPNARYERFQDGHPDGYQGVSSLLDEATRSSRIKFQDDGAIETPSIRRPFDDQHEVTESPRSPLEEVTVGHVFVDPSFFHDAERPVVQDASTIFGKTMTDHQPIATYFDASPYVLGYYAGHDQNAYQPISQEATIEMIKKPESNGVLVLQQQESTYTRKRKFPYPFYQPAGEYHDVQYAEEPHATIAYPQMRKLSPWKKIIGLIGTILPLGLLLATLTPNVIRINNTTTQPSIVLSKLRVVDLPVEHKRTPSHDDPSAACEGRSICELILAGSEPRSNILQNILWNLATRTPDDVAKRNGLREMFSAVRKRDCTTISC